MTGTTISVLDTAVGEPAAGVPAAFYVIGPDSARTFVRRLTTNSDGRCDEPILAGDEMQVRLNVYPYCGISRLKLFGVPKDV